MGRIGTLFAVAVLSSPFLGAVLGSQAPSAVRLSPVVVSGQLGTRPAIRTTAEPQQAGPLVRIVQRRKLGLTVRNIRQQIEGMKADGSLDEFIHDEDGTPVVDASSLAVEIAQRIRTERPQQWEAEGWEDWDWDAIFAFIEKIIQLIMSLLI